MYATANGFANMALNRDKVAQFVKGSRVMYKGWLHGYERAATLHGSKLLSMAARGARSTLGPSLVYGVSMRGMAALGLPSLVAVGAANVSTPVIVSKLGGSLSNLSTSSLLARAFPIAAHCVVEWGLYGQMKALLETRNVHLGGGADVGVPRTRMSMVMEGAVVGGICAAAATATTVLALSPLYGGKLLSRAVSSECAVTSAKLSMAAVRVTGIRLADSLQQGVVWFSTYEAMRASMAIYDEKVAEEEKEEAAAAPPLIIPTKLSVHAPAAEAAAGECVRGGDTASPTSPRSPRFSMKKSSSRISMSRTNSSSDFQSPRRISLTGGGVC